MRFICVILFWSSCTVYTFEQSITTHAGADDNELNSTQQQQVSHADSETSELHISPSHAVHHETVERARVVYVTSHASLSDLSPDAWNVSLQIDRALPTCAMENGASSFPEQLRALVAARSHFYSLKRTAEKNCFACWLADREVNQRPYSIAGITVNIDTSLEWTSNGRSTSRVLLHIIIAL